jgi:predicted Zn-dependent protease with MMP-like domain
MIEVNDETFQEMINKALESLPGEHAKSIKNIAILYAYEPTSDQRRQLLLHDDQTLLGLYEGVPLPKRQGETRLFPDKITLFKGPLTRISMSADQLQEEIRHTLWHEIGHYYGLDHSQIRKLES